MQINLTCRSWFVDVYIIIYTIIKDYQDTRWREMYHSELFWLADYFVHTHLGDAILNKHDLILILKYIFCFQN